MNISQLTDDDILDADYLACADDFYYWLANYGYMQDESGEVVGPGITPWPDQRDYIDRYRAGEWLIVGKSRRTGVSWLSTNADVYDLMFESNIRIPVIAQDDYWSMFHLARARWLYNMQPPWIARARPVVGRDNQHVLGLSNGSALASYPCTGKQGRGAGGKRIRLEEFAFFDNAEAVYAAVYGAVRDKGQLVIVSTGQGEGGTFHELWENAGSGAWASATATKRNRLHQIFLSWQARPDRPADFRDGMDQLQRQEFPETPGEMFLGTGSKFFDLALLAQRESMFKREPLRVEENGELRIYAEPVPGKRYVIGADVADGGDDSSAASVKDVATGETVAMYISNTIGSDTFGDVLYNLGKRYNWAYLGVERNNMGTAVLAILLRLRYPSLHYHQHYDPQAATAKPRAGYMTTPNSRPVMLGDYKRCMLDLTYGAVHDADVYQQLRAFGWYKGRWDHPPAGHDDCIFAEGIAQQMRQHVAAAGQQQDIVVYQGDRVIA